MMLLIDDGGVQLVANMSLPGWIWKIYLTVEIRNVEVDVYHESCYEVAKL